MKSIMEEASSITKAIEKGWHKAGQPKEFTVKIFEEPQKNFIGMTIKSAKIGIFFNDHVQSKVDVTKAKSIPSKSSYTQINTENRERDFAKKETKPSLIKETIRPIVKEKPIIKPIIINKEEKVEQQRDTKIWSEAMVTDISLWLKEVLSFISIKPFNFTVDDHFFNLRINFTEPIFEDKAREKQLFVSLSILLIQMLKNKYKRPLKGYKIILINP